MNHESPAGGRPPDVDPEREPGAEHREIDPERRTARDAARAAELDERQRRLASREAYQEAIHDERDREADERDREADKRDRGADERDREADTREQLADQREAQADRRELAALEPFMRAETHDTDAGGHDSPSRPSSPRGNRAPRPRHDPGEP
jgi:hypothetical protein